MKVETVNVWHKGSALIISKAVADAQGLKDNDVLKSEDQFWEVLSANASHMISICEHEIQNKQN